MGECKSLPSRVMSGAKHLRNANMRKRRWDLYVCGVLVESEDLPIEYREEDVIDYFVMDCGYPRSEVAVVQVGGSK
jgi:hypothetical protein